ncbi:hypothetical protein DdX_07681 [Ditylenchus destructor]|uniref:Uncharacterized protein n=1 Tax=Ditylenchus destructor TaxID=166010 RepID=A0AAD4R188_9BILA|nr:hypothetical protein DdX_07681 [Ditylenchus destructor]
MAVGPIFPLPIKSNSDRRHSNTSNHSQKERDSRRHYNISHFVVEVEKSDAKVQGFFNQWQPLTFLTCVIFVMFLMFLLYWLTNL